MQVIRAFPPGSPSVSVELTAAGNFVLRQEQYPEGLKKKLVLSPAAARELHAMLTVMLGRRETRKPRRAA